MRRAAALGALVGLACAPLVAIAGASPASAAPISVDFVCTTNAFGVDYDDGIQSYTVTMTAPASANAGSVVPVTYQFAPTTSPLPFAITGATLFARATVSTTGLTGPLLSSATSDGPTSTGATIPALGTIPAIQPVTVSVPTPASSVDGFVQFVPNTFAIVIAASNELPANSTITCTPQTTNTPGASTSLLGVPNPSEVDRCIAYNGDLTGGPGCTTTQRVSASLQPGQLVQRAYTNTTPATGTGVIDGTGITTPVLGTSNVNNAPTQINLGSITSPLAPTDVFGRLNDVTVSDNRGGTFGWSLTADVIDPDGAGSQIEGFNGQTGRTIAQSQLFGSPSCSAATAGNAWDYQALGQTVLSGFDPSLNAPGVTAGAANQSFGTGAITLCTKNQTTNATTQSTGGVYGVGGTLRLNLPAFQAADRYTAILQVTLA